MTTATEVRQIAARNGDVALAGSLWLPAATPAAVVLMHPGSGPSGRDNDVFFPPIRRHLLGVGVAVASFDKRGVGGSTGRWQEAAIEEQAEDALASLAAVRRELPSVAAGLFGHSQGGWVVVEAASRSRDAAFVVASSGPGVTPGDQERYATRFYMRKAGISETEVDAVVSYFDHLVSMMRAGVPFDEVERRVDDEGFPEAFARLSLPALPETEGEWGLIAALVDYDPRPALERIQAPVLALFGEADEIVPVEESVAVYREAVPPDRLRIEVFAGADHRVQTGDPPALADGYLARLTEFVLQAVA
jgi:pimeloyl-ACP methyl ester carboxylesterase